MIMVIVITGIVGGIVAVFLKAPIDQYMDVARRADMTDIADTALRRVTRDLRLALPNSVRVTGACTGAAPATCFIEFLQAPGGGRYRVGAGGTNDELNFAAADTSFEVLGSIPAMAVGNQIVVYNLGIAGADAYASNNRTAVSAPPAGAVANITSKLFPFDSPSHRFHVVTTPVSYVCDGAGTLTRWQGYPIQPGQPVALPAGGTSTTLANNVSNCRFSYDPLVVGRNGLVTMQLAITEQGETATLYNAVHVSNQP